MTRNLAAVVEVVLVLAVLVEEGRVLLGWNWDELHVRHGRCWVGVDRRVDDCSSGQAVL